jgi:hypothetical protein
VEDRLSLKNTTGDGKTWVSGANQASGLRRQKNSNSSLWTNSWSHKNASKHFLNGKGIELFKRF